MNVDFVFSDPHFEHKNVILHDGRPFPNVKEMGDRIIENFNSMVSPKDTTVFLGDIAWKNHAHYIHALNGSKILVLGNHDKMNKDNYKLFKEVHEIYRTTVDRQDISFCHYPMLSWASSPHGSWNLHGHCHGRLREFDDIFRLDCSCNVHNYGPVSMDFIRFIMSKRAGRHPEEPRQDFSYLYQRNLKTRYDVLKAIGRLSMQLIFKRDIIYHRQQMQNMKFLQERNRRLWDEFTGNKTTGRT